MADILIIDDDEDIADMVSLRLSLRGHTVHAQPNGLKGIEHAVQATPELILVDMQMPEINGEEVVERLRDKGFEGLIILLSAARIPEHLRRALDARCNGYISKPVERDFEDQIEKYLESAHV